MTSKARVNNLASGNAQHIKASVNSSKLVSSIKIALEKEDHPIAWYVEAFIWLPIRTLKSVVLVLENKSHQRVQIRLNIACESLGAVVN